MLFYSSRKCAFEKSPKDSKLSIKDKFISGGNHIYTTCGNSSHRQAVVAGDTRTRTRASSLLSHTRRLARPRRALHCDMVYTRFVLLHDADIDGGEMGAFET